VEREEEDRLFRRLIQRLPRICLAQAERANPLYRAYRQGFERFEPITAQPTLATAIQIGNPVSVKRAIRTLQRSTAWWSGPEQELTRRHVLTELACSTAPTPV
jgi:threonine synthase